MAKGGAYEREVCKLLSLWWTGGKDDGVFWRTSNSGGRATVRGRQGKKTHGHYGDVGTSLESGKPLLDLFTIEIKRGYNRCTIAELLDKPERAKVQKYEEWFEKCAADADIAVSESWLLIHKRDQREPVVFAPTTAIAALAKFNQSIASIVPEIAIRTSCVSSVRGYQLTSFLSTVRPKDIIDLSKSL